MTGMSADEGESGVAGHLATPVPGEPSSSRRGRPRIAAWLPISVHRCHVIGLLPPGRPRIIVKRVMRSTRVLLPALSGVLGLRLPPVSLPCESAAAKSFQRRSSKGASSRLRSPSHAPRARQSAMVGSIWP